ncbi:MAG: SIS domain-containing protein [Clostridiaceae bacterium]
MILGRTAPQWAAQRAGFTAEEIAQQPAVWKKTAAQIDAIRPKLDAFLANVTAKPDFDIVLAGAGTSEYVGKALLASLRIPYNGHVFAFGTTDIVATPRAYLSEDKPTLLVSFARSGNSPESVGAVAAADAVCKNIWHLFITCNAEGALAKAAETRKNCFSIVLAPETNDRGFAMTSSFTGMYLAALLAFLPQPKSALEAMCAASGRFLETGYETLERIVSGFPFERIVYLGTDVLKAVAQESALKMLELTGGKVTTAFDTPMGFRHGPKSIVNARTLTVVYLSGEPSTRRYELDLLKELWRDKRGGTLLAVGGRKDGNAEALCDAYLNFDSCMALNNALLAPLYVGAAQCLALFRSLSLGLTPDDPCPTGEVNRVVKGVTIYPVEGR